MNGYELHINKGFPNFSDLPWMLPLDQWTETECQREDVQAGISRHPVIFVRYDGILYAFKELPERNNARTEFLLLTHLNESGLPCVHPVGYAIITRDSIESSVLITRYLDGSLPYRSLFINKVMEQYQNHLLDAISGLLVQLHTNGFYWGDCSLSNVLFRPDAGALQAYLVDAETAEFNLPPLSPMLRFHDLEIMEENLFGELTDLQLSDDLSMSFPVQETGMYIQKAYRSLWDEITREIIFNESELFRVDERIRTLNSLGFSVRDIEIKKENFGNTLKLRIFVSDRNFHKNQLMEITGLHAEDRQAQQILNEIFELKANLSHSDTSMGDLHEVIEFWKKNIYGPVAEKLQTILDSYTDSEIIVDLIELYCQVLEHKWYLSERAQHDVGHQVAVDDFIHQYGHAG